MQFVYLSSRNRAVRANFFAGDFFPFFLFGYSIFLKLLLIKRNFSDHMHTTKKIAKEEF